MGTKFGISTETGPLMAVDFFGLADFGPRILSFLEGGFASRRVLPQIFGFTRIFEFFRGGFASRRGLPQIFGFTQIFRGASAVMGKGFWGFSILRYSIHNVAG